MVSWMDARRTETLKSVVLQKTAEDSLRLPLAPTERIQKSNASRVASKPRSREAMSRCRSGTSTTTSPSMPATPPRSPSPAVKQMGLSPPSLVKHSQSTERRRPSTPTSRTSATSSPSSVSRPSTPVHDIAADLRLSCRRLSGGRTLDGLWPSMRSLSSSFQSEYISVPSVKKNKPISSANVTGDQTSKSSSKNVKIDRKKTPSREKSASEQLENLKPVENLHARVIDQRRLSLMNGKSSVKDISKSVDLSDRGRRSVTLPTSVHGVPPTRRSHAAEGQSRNIRKIPNEDLKRLSSDESEGLGHESRCFTSFSVDHSERSSSMTNPGVNVAPPLPGLPSASSPVKTSSPSNFSRSTGSSSCMRPSTPPNKNSLPSTSSRSIVSPFRSRPSTPSSPSKRILPSASSGSLAISSSTRPSSPSCPAADRPIVSSSVLSYTLDVRKGKKNANQMEALHQLRFLYNRVLEWRFVNARADAAMSIQKLTAENTLYSVWSITSQMRASVAMKKIKIQKLRQEMKVNLILNEQMACLEDWVLLEREHFDSLLAAADTLKASTLQLPVTGGARVDDNDLKDVITSSVDIMQAMSSSVYQLLSRVEGIYSVVSELAALAEQERAMLTECRELLASIAAMQVQESSLRTQLLQMKQDVTRVKSHLSQ